MGIEGIGRRSEDYGRQTSSLIIDEVRATNSIVVDADFAARCDGDGVGIAGHDGHGGRVVRTKAPGSLEFHVRSHGGEGDALYGSVDLEDYVQELAVIGDG
jgi:hypothetical protein